MSRTVEQRFWAKVDKTETCWLWTGWKNHKGYGYLTIAGKNVRAHRWAYEQLVGLIDGDLTVDHLCRVKECVNPAHMELVTREENSRRGSKGRAGTESHCAAGHAYTAETSYINPTAKRPRRRCRICQARYKSAHEARMLINSP